MRRFNKVLSLLTLGFIALFIIGTDGTTSSRCFRKPNLGKSCGKQGHYYYYVVAHNMCVSFVYTGCNTVIEKNENRFKTFDECENVCLRFDK
ncbi:kunitz-type serine protease inhibitor-like [Drosophila hydei]|uniref:Kunitz-type serine protease inhibitor-like n=1 Tax=Drosophila hydei TaxID=7224 RepID=A0A6J1M1E1_DROHY|nr:kunitz-type serine protease inhibitor-like [Drosophila hydei]